MEVGSGLTSREPAWGVLINDLPLHAQVEIHIQKGTVTIFWGSPSTAYELWIRSGILVSRSYHGIF